MGIAPRNDQDERLHPSPTMKENSGMKRRGYGSRKRLRSMTLATSVTGRIDSYLGACRT
uniref:Uncharacterized protein n=1 Tax=Candidatus Kentrum sp. DK TaxID=2126562 RepID=A0A450RW00_9GAMM|nr:MAG: hypothetical protein BECKDK2373C_GA0170839_10058 [Candidatus Kentron sp. DK]